MGSRIQEALEESTKLLGDILRTVETHREDRIKRVMCQNSAAIAFLTAEPEPCEDADHVIDQLEKITGVDRTEESGPFACIDRAKGKAIVDSYATQVADKRAEELREQVETLREALLEAKEAMDDRRGYCEAWEWKYRDAWNREDHLVNEALAATEPKPPKESI